MFQYRITPYTTTGVAPSQLLMGRRIRSRLDIVKPSGSGGSCTRTPELRIVPVHNLNQLQVRLQRVQNLVWLLTHCWTAQVQGTRLQQRLWLADLKLHKQLLPKYILQGIDVLRTTIVLLSSNLNFVVCHCFLLVVFFKKGGNAMTLL